MKTISRRTLLGRCFTFPAMLALGNLTPTLYAKAGGNIGYFNLYLQGPFSLVFFPGQAKILVLAPIAADHHEPSMTSDTDETVITQSQDYQLVGPSSSNQTTWQYPDPNVKVQRLTVPAAALGMDKGGMIDKGKQKRYFSLMVPAPDMIIPWHPVSVLVKGNNSPFKAATLLPVGYVFAYSNTDLSTVKINCLTDPTKNWNPNLLPFPNQSGAEIVVEMTSLLDSDPCHKVAIDSFASGRDLYQDVNPSQKLDLGLTYPNDNPACCPHPKSGAAKSHGPADAKCAFAHTGADCKAAILEITDASDSVVLG